MFKKIRLFFKRLFKKNEKDISKASEEMIKALDDMTSSMRLVQEAMQKFGMTYADALQKLCRKELK